MSFCPNCGNQIADNEKFCANCGTPNSDFKENKEQGSKKKLGIIVFSVFVVFVALALIIILPGRGYKSTAKQFATALEKGNTKAIVNLIPKDYIKEMLNDGDYKNKKELIEDFEDKIPDFSQINLKIAIKGYETCDKSELEYIKNEYEYKDFKKPSKAKIVTYSIKIDGDAGIYNYIDGRTQDFTLVKIGKNWYIDGSDFF